MAGSSYSTGRCIRKTLRSSRSRAQQRCAAQSGINPRLGVCCRGFETQPTPDVLALALGEHEGAQTLMGPLATHCCCVVGHNRLQALLLIAGNDPWPRFQWIGIGAGCTAILILLQFASRRIEERQL